MGLETDKYLTNETTKFGNKKLLNQNLYLNVHVFEKQNFKALNYSHFLRQGRLPDCLFSCGNFCTCKFSLLADLIKFLFFIIRQQQIVKHGFCSNFRILFFCQENLYIIWPSDDLEITILFLFHKIFRS